VEQTVQRALHDRPLAVGAAALAIGTMVGCALPSTKAENELMGETRDDVFTRAGGAVHEAAASVAKMSETTGRDDASSPGREKRGHQEHAGHATESRPSS